MAVLAKQGVGVWAERLTLWHLSSSSLLGIQDPELPVAKRHHQRRFVVVDDPIGLLRARGRL